MSIVMIVLSSREHHALKNKAIKKNMTVSRFIRYLIEREIDDEKTVSN